MERNAMNELQIGLAVVGALILFAIMLTFKYKMVRPCMPSENRLAFKISIFIVIFSSVFAALWNKF